MEEKWRRKIFWYCRSKKCSTQSKVFYYKITTTSTNEDIFKNFMEDLYDSLSFNQREKLLFFFLDNLSAHSTAKLFTFYKKNKNENII